MDTIRCAFPVEPEIITNMTGVEDFWDGGSEKTCGIRLATAGSGCQYCDMMEGMLAVVPIFEIVLSKS